MEEEGKEFAKENFFCLQANTYRRRSCQLTPRHNKKDTN